MTEKTRIDSQTPGVYSEGGNIPYGTANVNHVPYGNFLNNSFVPLELHQSLDHGASYQNALLGHDYNNSLSLTSNYSSQHQKQPSNTQNPRESVVVGQLIYTADTFINNAHKSVTKTTTASGLEAYQKMIKAALSSLMLAMKKYGHYVGLETQLYIMYRIAKLYLEETTHLDRAEEYARNAASVISKSNIHLSVELRFHCNILIARILALSDAKIVTGFVNDTINYYVAIQRYDFVTCFRLFQVNFLLRSDPAAGLVLLQTLTKGQQLDPVSQILCLLYQSNLHLYRGSPLEAEKLLKEAELSLSIIRENSGNQPTSPLVVIYAIILLQRYLYLIQTHSADVKAHLKAISMFLTEQNSSGWALWSKDGAVYINRYKVQWLSSDEFVLAFYFLTGVSLLSEVANGKRKSSKVFDKCLRIIDKRIREMNGAGERNCSVTHMRDSKVRLRYLRYSIHYYEAWLGFLCNEPKAISYLNEFMQDYNQGFSVTELAKFKHLIPRVLHLFAVYYQIKGDLQAAKYYYIKVRNLLSFKPTESHANELDLDPLQGRDLHNELFIYATIHLLILTEFEIQAASKKGEVSSHFYELQQKLHQDLISAFQPSNAYGNTFLLNFVQSDSLLKLTYHLILHIFNDQASGEDQLRRQHSINDVLVQEMSRTLDTMENTVCFPFLSNLISYLIYTRTENAEERRVYHEKCLEIMGRKAETDTEKIINIFILKSLIQQFKESGQNEKVSMAEFQLKYFYDGLNKKFSFLNSNTVPIG